MQKENTAPVESHQYVGPYRLEKTLGKGQTGKCQSQYKFFDYVHQHDTPLHYTTLHYTAIITLI